jgi:hypothetical protein
MRRQWTAALAAGAVLALAAGPARANGPVTASANELTLAVIGDTPYGAEQLEQFPALVADINADPKVDLALHVGDIKSGSTSARTRTSRRSSRCSRRSRTRWSTHPATTSGPTATGPITAATTEPGDVQVFTWQRVALPADTAGDVRSAR